MFFYGHIGFILGLLKIIMLTIKNKLLKVTDHIPLIVDSSLEGFCLHGKQQGSKDSSDYPHPPLKQNERKT